MLKDDILKLLEDPEVVSKIKEVLSNKKVLTSSDKRKATTLQKWWCSALKITPTTLTDTQVKDIVTKINQYGSKDLMKFLQIAIDSPLNRQGELMHTYLSDLSWCLRDANLSKILAGKYSHKFSNGKPEPFKNKDEDFEFNTLLK